MKKLYLLFVAFCLVANPLQAQQGQIKITPTDKPPRLDKGVTGNKNALSPAVVMLKMVTVKLPDVYCLFHPKCEFLIQLPDNEVVSDIVINGAKGKGILQTRTGKGEPGSAAAGMYLYIYRVDMTGISNATGKIPTFTSFTINFGPVVDTLDFNGDGKKGEQVFIVTQGALGSLAPGEAIYDGSNITFTFNNPRLNGAGASSKGQSSFSFGLVSKSPPRNVGVRAVVNEGTGVNLSSRGPNF